MMSAQAITNRVTIEISDKIRTSGNKVYVEIYVIIGRIDIGDKLTYRNDTAKVTSYNENLGVYEIKCDLLSPFNRSRGKIVTVTVD